MHTSSKGWYISKLKEMGITKHEERKLEQYKTHVIANLYKSKINN
jgi:hypothetical protein